jgi:hypothetical protein
MLPAGILGRFVGKLARASPSQSFNEAERFTSCAAANAASVARPAQSSRPR